MRNKNATDDNRQRAFEKMKAKRISMVTRVFTVSALSLHSLLEGVLLGLEEKVAGFWILFVGK